MEATNLVDRGSEFGGSPYYDPSTLGATSLPSYWRLDLGFRRMAVGVAGRDASVGLFCTATKFSRPEERSLLLAKTRTGRASGIEMRHAPPWSSGSTGDSDRAASTLPPPHSLSDPPGLSQTGRAPGSFSWRLIGPERAPTFHDNSWICSRRISSACTDT